MTALRVLPLLLFIVPMLKIAMMEIAQLPRLIGPVMVQVCVGQTIPVLTPYRSMLILVIP